jgi:hypothetical protein
MDTVWLAVTKLYGEVGASLTSLALINFDGARKIFVIRSSLVSLPVGVFGNGYGRFWQGCFDACFGCFRHS